MLCQLRACPHALDTHRLDAPRPHRKRAAGVPVPSVRLHVQVARHGPEASAGFLSVGPEPVLLTALFASGRRAGGRDGALYARLWNASGRRRRAVLRSGGRLRAVPCDLDLSPEAGDGDPRGALSLRPWGIQTVRIQGLRAGIQLT